MNYFYNLDQKQQTFITLFANFLFETFKVVLLNFSNLYLVCDNNLFYNGAIT